MWMSWARGASAVIWASSITRTPHGVKREMVRGAWYVVSSPRQPRPTLPRTLLRSTPGLLTDFRIRAAYSEGAGIHRIVPAAVAVPRGVEELQELVRWAGATGTPLVPRGAGSGMAGGSVGRGVVVDLSRGFNWTAPGWPARRLWAGASVTWAELTAAARPFGLRLPPDPSSGAFATSGGMVATNAAGPRSVRCGSVRRWIQAVELFDRTLLDGVRDVGARSHLPEGLEGLLLIEFERETQAAGRGVVGDAVRGVRGSTARVATAVDRASLETLWAVRRLASPALARLPDNRRSLQVVEDGCVPLERLADYITGIRAAAAELGIPVAIFGHAGDGHVHVNALPDLTVAGWRDALAALYADTAELLLRLGGTPSGEHGVGRLRAGLLERFYGPEVTGLFRELKHAYDSRGTLNPGVIIPSADWAPFADLKVGPEAAPIPDDIAARLREVERTAGWATPKLDLASASP